MVKILFFIEKFGGGGAEKVLRDLVNHMDQTMFDITVQSVWPYEEGKLLVPGVKYKSVYPASNMITEKLYRAEAATGMLYQLHVKDNYDIECAFLEAGPTKVIASSTNQKAKKYAWIHCDLMKAIDNTDSYAAKTAKRYAKFDQVICVSETVKKSFDQIFSKRFPSAVLYNVVDDEAIRTAAEIPCPASSEHTIVLAVGTIYPPKNYPRLISAHKRLLEDGLYHEVWILGDGPDRQKIEQMISEQKLKNSVSIFGFQKNPYSFMKRADILVCSSNYEGFSTAITEGTILGKAIVTTDCSGMRELLGDSEYGLITDNSDEGFYNGLKAMLQDIDMRKKYSKKALERGRSFSAYALTGKTEEFLLTGENES